MFGGAGTATDGVLDQNPMRDDIRENLDIPSSPSFLSSALTLVEYSVVCLRVNTGLNQLSMLGLLCVQRAD
jgi:hypothetical protein